MIFALLISYRPELIPLDLGVWGLDALMAAPIMGWLLTVIFCVGFINAVNMADGANGLMPGILAIAFSLFFAETGFLVYAALMTSCGLFTIFNVISGRIFLGDAGSYGLGAALVLSGLFLFSEGVFSAPFLAVLACLSLHRLCVSHSATALGRAGQYFCPTMTIYIIEYIFIFKRDFVQQPWLTL